MKFRSFLYALAIIIAGAALTRGQAPAVVVFEGASVVPMDRERVLANQTVVVRDGRIAAVGAAGQVTAPAGATRVDARNHFLIPALAEMHAHLPNTPADAERVLFLYAANGIGTIRSMLGHPGHFALRERARRGEIVAPLMLLSGPSFSGQTVPDEAAAIARVKEQKAAGYDLLKIHPGVRRPVFDAMAATADKLGIRFAGHVPADVGLARALEAKYWTIDHLDGYVEALAGAGSPPSALFGVNLVARANEAELPALVARTKAAGTWMVPTQILLENWLNGESPEAMAKRPEMRYAAPDDVTQWIASKRKATGGYPLDQRERFIALRRRIIKALHDGGVGLLLGSDAPQVWNVPGFSIHRELQTLTASGLTPYQALVTGTRNVATYLGAKDRGTIEQGKAADLVLLQGNPLQDIAQTSRIAGVMIGGRWLPKAEIDKRLSERR